MTASLLMIVCAQVNRRRCTAGVCCGQNGRRQKKANTTQHTPRIEDDVRRQHFHPLDRQQLNHALICLDWHKKNTGFLLGRLGPTPSSAHVFLYHWYISWHLSRVCMNPIRTNPIPPSTRENTYLLVFYFLQKNVFNSPISSRITRERLISIEIWKFSKNGI